MTKPYSPFDKTFFRFSAVHYSGTSATDFETLTERLEAFSITTILNTSKSPMSSSTTQKASIQEGTLTLWRDILQEHQFWDTQHVLFN